MVHERRRRRPLTDAARTFLGMLRDFEAKKERPVSYDEIVAHFDLTPDYTARLLDMLTVRGLVRASNQANASIFYSVIQMEAQEKQEAEQFVDDLLEATESPMRYPRGTPAPGPFPDFSCTICGSQTRVLLIRLNSTVHHDACQFCITRLKPCNQIEYVSVGPANQRFYHDQPVIDDEAVLYTFEEWQKDLEQEEFSATDEKLEWLRRAIPYIVGVIRTPRQK